MAEHYLQLFIDRIAPNHDLSYCSDQEPKAGLFIRANDSKYDYACLRCKCLNILRGADRNGTPLDYTKL